MTGTTVHRALTEDDLYLFAEGTHGRLAEKLGAHPHAGGTSFAVWAPNAEGASVIGDFNGWDASAHPLSPVRSSGIWSGLVEEARPGHTYKFHIRSRHAGYQVDKADPFAVHAETPPKTGSIVWDLAYDWGDADWLSSRAEREGWASPMAIYEVHLGSWRRGADGGWLGYRDVAPHLADHALDLGFTHVELLPVMEHPFYGSWGYQTTGYFAPTGRFGSPQDLMFLIDHLHQRGLGVILDWVPSHFPADEHGLASFDGTHLYEHADPRRGYHPDWHSLIFNYGRNEVRSFLLSSAMHWLRAFHADGLRVDAVASMLYLDYSRREGEWLPNRHGGRENLEAVEFLKELNIVTHGRLPGTITVAEESTSWPAVSRPTFDGGLGFTYKWNMGWMHDMLAYMREDPVHRRWHHGQITFSMLYAFTENFVLPFSHDEVVYGKRSMLEKMPGDDWQKHASLRALYGYMFSHPGKKLMFMGAEFGQWREWNYDSSLDWHLLDDRMHDGLRRWVRDLNHTYQRERSLHEVDFEGAGFSWIDGSDNENSVVSLIRRARNPQDFTVMLTNFTPVPRPAYRVGVPEHGWYRELLNSD